MENRGSASFRSPTSPCCSRSSASSILSNPPTTGFRSFLNEDAARRFVRLLLESMESAFFLANIYLENYGFAKIFDIINQIIPTAYVYDTGYWVFYNNQYKQSICVCEKFGIRCPHVRNQRHFVNLAPLVESVGSYFQKPFIGKLDPVFIDIKVIPILKDVLRAYDATITVTVRPLCFRNNQFVIIGREKSTFRFETRYVLTPEHFPLRNKLVIFSPSPLKHYVFTSYFQSVERFIAFPVEVGYEMQLPLTHTVVPGDLPKFGVLSYDTVDRSHPTRQNWYQENNSVFPDAFSSTWARPEDNSYQVSIPGGSLNHTTECSVSFCKQKRDTVINVEASGHGRNRYILVGFETKLKQNPKKFAKKKKNFRSKFSQQSCESSPVPPTIELNFLGSDYEDAFPSLAQSSHCKGIPENTANSGQQQEAQDNNNEPSTSTATIVEECTYAKQAACKPTARISPTNYTNKNIFFPFDRKVQGTQAADENVKMNSACSDYSISSTNDYPPLPRSCNRKTL